MANDAARRRTYSGASHDDTVSTFEADAAEAAKHGWHPVEETWAGATLVVVYEQLDEEAIAEAEPIPSEVARAYHGGKPPALFKDAAAEEKPTAPTTGIDKPHAYVHDPPTVRCRLCGLGRGAEAHRGSEEAASVPVSQREDSRQQPAEGTDQRIVWLLGTIAVIVAVGVFWVIATPHEQCYISDGGLFSVERPIERTGPDTYRGIPSEFRNGDYISSDAVIDCHWELGEPYRVTLFGS